MENLLVPYQAVTKIPATQVLVLAPHPDDEVFDGAVYMRHVAQGILLSASSPTAIMASMLMTADCTGSQW